MMVGTPPGLMQNGPVSTHSCSDAGWPVPPPPGTRTEVADPKEAMKVDIPAAAETQELPTYSTQGSKEKASGRLVGGLPAGTQGTCRD